MNMTNKKSFFYILVSILLLLCLLDMPYGFYSFVRFAASAAFCFFAYEAKKSENKDRMILFIILAVLFQPFVKIPLGRSIWNIIDVVVAIYLFYILFRHISDKG